ncbi:MAG: hypothetical protein ABID87_06560 [Chloroflexota bacterium]
MRTGDIYGIVAHATTGSLEPGRRPIARGKDETSEEAIYRASPQLAQLLSSEFETLVVGYREDGNLRRYLPPAPVRIHGFVYRCPAAEVREFSQSPDFLNILVNARTPAPPDELIAATLRQMSQAQEDPQAFLVVAGKALAALLGGQFPVLKSVLGRLQ